MQSERDGLVPIGDALAGEGAPRGEGYRIALPRVRLSGLS